MLATRFGAITFPPTMSNDNDSMEISPENGHDGGDEDIDIDIEFTTAAADEEDYAIEDATSNSGFDGLQPQPSPTVGNDDLMIDEDPNSFTMGDGDGDGAEDVVLNDHDHRMEPEATAATISFAMGDSPHSTVDEHADPLPDLEAEGEIMWEEQVLPKPTLGDSDVLLDDSEQTFNQEEVEIAEHVDENDPKENEESSKLPSEHGSYTTTPKNKTTPSGTPDEPRSPATSIPEPGPVSPKHKANYPTPKSGFQAVSGGTDEFTKPAFENGLENSSAPEIIVVYQSREYTLFAKSESDDPDSFFLSDISILAKPLSNFFTDIRDVIQDDLGDEDELCISVEDLALEIEEVRYFKPAIMQSLLTILYQNSAFDQKASLGQIIGLYETLLRNDGVESHRPLCIALGTRLNFSKRLANLTTAAAEGKGLSDLSWDDESGVDDSGVDDWGVVDESIESREPNLDVQENGDVPQITPVDTAEGFVVESNHASPSPPASVPDKQGEQEAAENTEGSKHVDANPSPTHVDFQNKTATDLKPSTLLPSTEKATSEYVEDEDDLIDYSEGEDDLANLSPGTSKPQTDNNRPQDGIFDDSFSPCILPQTCFCNACNELLHAEYDRINEQLRRRSLTRAAEEIEHSLHHVNGEHEQHSRADEEVGDEYEEYVEGELEHGVQGEPENLTAEDILGTAELEDYNEHPLVHDDQNQDLIGVPGHDPSVVFDDENELQYLGDDAELGQEEPQSELHNNLGGTSIPARELDAADTAESSATVSADDQHAEEDLGEYDLGDFEDTGDSHTLDNAASSGAIEIQEDEINYEDDEDEKEQVPNGSSAPSPASNDASGSNGKRPRADAETDDTSRSKGMHHLVMLRSRSA